MKRQRGRGRKPNGQSNRPLESNVGGQKTRGSASQIFERYQQLARDASSSGDPVVAENYLQHAEHYLRIMRASQQAQRERADAEAEARDAEAAAQDDTATDAEQQTGGGSNPMDVVTPETGALVPEADAENSAEQPSGRRPRRPRRTRGKTSGSGDVTEAREALDAAGADDGPVTLDPAASA